MANPDLTLKVVTPEGTLYTGRAAFVAVPGAEGEIGILPSHAPLIAQLGTGELRIHHGSLSGDVTERFAVRGGFVQVMANFVTVLAAEAKRKDALDAAALGEEREELLGDLRHPESDEAYAELLELRRWVETREKIERR